MKFIKTKIDGLYIIEPKVFIDKRGSFLETFNQKIFEEVIGKVHFVQDNESTSLKGVVRGLHFQTPPFAQAKLVRCTHGKILDVVVDLRKGSSTYGKSNTIILSSENKCQLYIPRGFAHGFLVLSDIAIFSYKVDNIYSPDFDAGIRWKDNELDIQWGGVEESELIINEKDANLPLFSNFNSPFII